MADQSCSGSSHDPHNLSLSNARETGNVVTITEDQLREEIRKAVRRLGKGRGGVSALAVSLGVSRQLLSSCLLGNKPVPPSVYKGLGYRKLVKVGFERV